MIPKTIHYCWFGHGEKPGLVKKCIRSWKEFCPDYTIIEWNENNYDISSAPLYVKQAVESKQWAFATDYIRYQIVYENGGIYLDTDVQVLKNLDSFLDNKAYFGIQFNYQIASGLGFGAEKGTPILSDLMKNYRQISFFLPNGTYDSTPCPRRDASVFKAYGFLQNGEEQMLHGGIHVYPAEIFCPYGYHDRKLRKTHNTATIHWYAASWHSKEQKREMAYYLWRDRINEIKLKAGQKVIGKRNYERLKILLKGSKEE